MNEFKREKITLRNDFHNTEAVVFANPVPVRRGGVRYFIGADAAKRARRKLCAAKECTCGGIRGPQEVTVEEYDYDGTLEVIF